MKESPKKKTMDKQRNLKKPDGRGSMREKVNPKKQKEAAWKTLPLLSRSLYPSLALLESKVCIEPTKIRCAHHSHQRGRHWKKQHEIDEKQQTAKKDLTVHQLAQTLKPPTQQNTRKQDQKEIGQTGAIKLAIEPRTQRRKARNIESTSSSHTKEAGKKRQQATEKVKAAFVLRLQNGTNEAKRRGRR